MCGVVLFFFFSSRRRHTRCALVTGVQTCALPIFPTVPASTTAQFAPVSQESVMAYEIGTKISALDRALQLNAAAFHYIYYDKQVRGLIVDPIFNQLDQLVNIPKARINGAEKIGRAHVWTPGTNAHIECRI